jgi:Putative auto-transporter adhesin, head GIN domain
MKKHFTFFFCLVATALPLLAQNRSVRNFDAIDVRMAVDVILTQSPDYSLRLEVPQRFQRQIITRVSNGTLVIDARGRITSYNEPMRIYVSAPTFKSISLSGSGNIKLDRLNDNHLNLNVSGSGNVDMNSVRLRTIYMALSGSGNVDISGTTSFMDIALSGSGNIEARDFNAESVKASIAGSGNIVTHAVRTLNATVAGSGSIQYRGNPRITQNIVGSGNLRRL